MRNIKSRKNNDVQNYKSDGTILKIGILVLFIVLSFTVIIYKLYDIMFVKGEQYSQSAYNQQTKNKILSPNRGIIYDRNGDILAKSVTVKTISVNPGKVCYSSGKKVEDKVIAQGLSEMLEIDYEETLGKVSASSSVSVISKKVDEKKADNLKNWLSENKISTGVNIDEDTKRYYPYSNLASNLIGFCGSDNDGIIGLEERWNSTLKGVSGKIVTVQDVRSESISDDTEQYIPAENGKNIYLTIDVTAQQIVEKYLKKAVEDNKCEGGGSVIVMNPNNGEILAMASYPDYDLNEPFLVEPTGDSDVWSELTTAEKNDSYNNLWSNKNVTRVYEPGSTFKLVTAAVALEENVIKTDGEGDFLCNGVETVEDYEIHCWRAVPHGYQTLRQALCNSCNPAFIQLGQKIGIRTLYKYYEAFGLFDTLGSKIGKTYKAVFHELEKAGKVELATISFGQRFEISPLQLITAVSAIVNGGELVEPKVVSKIEDTDTGIIDIQDTNVIRQVISEETSDKIRDMMKSVVVDGTGKRAAVQGYTIGGKSGTSEPTEGNEDQGYVASFIAVAPIDDPQVIVLIILNDPEGETYQGGQTAGPVASNILTELLPYLEIDSNDKTIVTQSTTSLTTPDVSEKTVSSAKQILESYGFKVESDSDDESNSTVIDQTPKSGTVLDKGAKIYLYTDANTSRISTKVPSLTGLTLSEAKEKLESSNLNIKVDGTDGTVISQTPLADTSAEQGSVVNVVIK